MAVNLESLFNPKTVAIIGASRDPSKVGNVILSKLMNSGFQGEIFPVNPNATKVKGLTCHNSVLDIAVQIDVAVISIPAVFVKEALEDCGQKGIKFVVIISAGFAEAGEAGKELEKEIEEIAAKYHIQILGPNCLGYISTYYKTDVTFSDADPLRGNVALVSQSGAIGTAFLDWARENKVGLAHFVSLGNKAGLNENDFLTYLLNDKRVGVILMYIEQFSDGRKFFELARKITLHKPVVVLKPGIFSATQKAMQSHTGSLAQDEKIVAAALRDAGCIHVHTIEELFNVTKVLSWQPPLTGNRIVVITNAGGIGIQSVDDLTNNGFVVPPLPEMILKKFKHLFANQINISNPIDLLGDASAEKYRLALETVIKNNQIDCILVLLSPQKVTEALLTAELVNSIADKFKKVVVASFVGGEKLKTAVQYLNVNKIPHFTFPNDAAGTLGLVLSWINYLQQEKLEHKAAEPVVHDEINPEFINPELSGHSGTNGAVELAYVQQLCRQFQVSLVPSEIVDNQEELLKQAKKMGFPLVLKLTHPLLIHKTEFKAVRYPLENAEELLQNFRELAEIAARQNLSGARYELQPFFSEKLEVFLGIKKDPGFGHFMLVGTGGIYTEIFQDIALKILPLSSKAAAERFLQETKIGMMLSGARGKEFDSADLLTLMVNISKLVMHNTNLKEIDINPVFVTPKAAYVADIKMFI